jgi:hypothetical protein
MKLQLVSIVAVLGPVLLGCNRQADTTISSLSAGPSPLALSELAGPVAAQATVIDISGLWSFTETVNAQMPIEVIEQFGVPLQPEGRITHLICENSGIATFVQTGSTFNGTQETQLSRCVTRGGQVLEGFFALTFSVRGYIEGRSVHAEDPNANCPASFVALVSDGVATGMRGRANCHGLLPGGVLNTVTIEYSRL